MKSLLTLIILLAGFNASAQMYHQNPSAAEAWKRTKADSTAHIPTFCGAPTLRNSPIANQSAIAFDSCNHRFYFYDPKTLVWDTIKGGGAGGGISLAQLNDTLKKYLSDIFFVGNAVYQVKNRSAYLIGTVATDKYPLAGGNLNAGAFIGFPKIATPATPAAGYVNAFFDNTSRFSYINSNGYLRTYSMPYPGDQLWKFPYITNGGTVADSAAVAIAVALKQNLVSITTNGTGAASFNQGSGILNIPIPASLAGWGLNGNATTYPNAYLGTIGNSTFRLITNNVERVNVDSLGNVNIGTTVTDSNLVLNVASGTKGSKPWPSYTTAGRDSLGFIFSLSSVTTPGSGYTNGTTSGVALNNIAGNGYGAKATVTVSGGVVTSVIIDPANRGRNYKIGDIVTPALANTTSSQSTVLSLGLTPGTHIYNITTKSDNFWDGTAWQATASQGNGAAWTQLGNATNPGTDFLGTTNNTSLRIKVNNIERLRIDSLGNVSIAVGGVNGTNWVTLPTGVGINFDGVGLNMNAGQSHNSIGYTGSMTYNASSLSQGHSFYLSTNTAPSFRISNNSSGYYNFIANPLTLGANAAQGSGALLDMQATDKGLLIPRMTTSQATAIASPGSALQVYDTNLKRPKWYDGTNWVVPEYTTTGTAAPTSTPMAVGDKFIDTANKKIYFATGTTSSSDWTIVN